ncbi:MAG: agmatinase [Thermoguttaceae bacterium]|nr:agmatinase [Thermoguttaceae bacterium]
MNKQSAIFLELPPEYTGEHARYVIFPVPFEGTVCFEKGTANGPRRILEVSDQMEYIDEETLIEFWKPGIRTLAPLPAEPTPRGEMEAIYARAKRESLFAEGRFPITLGGEHSITAPLLRAAAETYPELSILQFDAHSDLRESFPPGGRDSHASVMRRALEITPNLVQVGIRSFSEEDLVSCPEQVRRFITPARLEDDFDAALAEVIVRLSEKVYITIDMDVFDPAFAPGVGTPEPGGLSWRQICRILRTVFREKIVIGADVVETAPITGQVVTEFLAARLIAKLMAYDQAASR